MGLAGFFAGSITGYAGGWGGGLLFQWLLKDRSALSAFIGGMTLSGLLVVCILAVTLTDSEIPFGWNTVGMIIGLPLGAFLGGMKIIAKSDAENTL